MKRNTIFAFFAVLALLLSACLPNTGSVPVVPATSLPSATDTPGSVPVTQANTLPDSTPTASPTATLESPVEIIHETWPGTPKYLDTQLIWDCTMGYNYETYGTLAIVRGCDAWSINYIERPVTTGQDEYLPYIDIEIAQFGSGGGWFYARIFVYEASVPVDGTSFAYLWELDKNFDGRGDVLVMVENLPLDATEWSVMGIRAWKDTNGDVGAVQPIRSEEAVSGDGYDTLLFDEGQGTDPDLIWARRSPTNPRAIEIAFKSDLLDRDESFLWWAWAMRGTVDPSRFDLVDNFSELYELDDTCSMEFNGNLMGFPNSCRTIQPTPTAAPSCVKPPKPNIDYYWDPVRCKWFQFN